MSEWEAFCLPVILKTNLNCTLHRESSNCFCQQDRSISATGALFGSVAYSFPVGLELGILDLLELLGLAAFCAS